MSVKPSWRAWLSPTTRRERLASGAACTEPAGESSGTDGDV